MIRKTWQGYEVSRKTKHGTLYLRSVYKGKANWVWDYTHAGHYSEKTARIHDENVRNGVYR